MPRFLVAEVLPNGAWVCPSVVAGANHGEAVRKVEFRPGTRLAVWLLGEHPETYHVGTTPSTVTAGQRL